MVPIIYKSVVICAGSNPSHEIVKIKYKFGASPGKSCILNTHNHGYKKRKCVTDLNALALSGADLGISREGGGFPKSVPPQNYYILATLTPLEKV